MDPATITLLAFSSVLVVGSATVIIMVNYRKCVKPQTTTQGTVVDWARDVVSQNVRV